MPQPPITSQAVDNGLADGTIFLRISAIEAPKGAGNFKNITAASAINVFAGAGKLESILFHASTTARVVLFDSTTFGNNTIGTIDGVPTKLTQLNYFLDCSAGLTVSAVSSPGNFTVSWTV